MRMYIKLTEIDDTYSLELLLRKLRRLRQEFYCVQTPNIKIKIDLEVEV